MLELGNNAGVTAREMELLMKLLLVFSVKLWMRFIRSGYGMIYSAPANIRIVIPSWFILAF